MKTTWRTPYVPIGRHARAGVSVGMRFIFGMSLQKLKHLPAYAFHICFGPFTLRVEWRIGWRFARGESASE